MEKASKPQISKDLFSPLLDQETVDKGTRIYKMLDQKKSHWQFKCYKIKCMTKDGLLVIDADDRNWIIPMDELPAYYIFKGHVTINDK